MPVASRGPRRGLALATIRCFGHCGRSVPDDLQQTPMVERVDPFQGGELHRPQTSPRAPRANQLRPVQSDDRLGSVIAGIVHAPHPLLEGVEHESRAQRVSHPPAHDAQGKGADDEGSVDAPARVTTKAQRVRQRRPQQPIDPVRRDGSVATGVVVLTLRPRTTQRRPSSRISRATVRRATAKPSRRSWRRTLRTPYTGKFSSRTRRICFRNCVSRPPRAGKRLSSASRALASAGRRGDRRHLQIGSTPYASARGR